MSLCGCTWRYLEWIKWREGSGKTHLNLDAALTPPSCSLDCCPSLPLQKGRATSQKTPIELNTINRGCRKRRRESLSSKHMKLGERESSNESQTFDFRGKETNMWENIISYGKGEVHRIPRVQTRSILHCSAVGGRCLKNWPIGIAGGIAYQRYQWNCRNEEHFHTKDQFTKARRRLCSTQVPQEVFKNSKRCILTCPVSMQANKNARLHEMQTKIVDSNEANSSAKEKSAPRSETMATSHHLLPNIENGRKDLPTTCKADIFFSSGHSGCLA